MDALRARLYLRLDAPPAGPPARRDPTPHDGRCDRVSLWLSRDLEARRPGLLTSSPRMPLPTSTAPRRPARTARALTTLALLGTAGACATGGGAASTDAALRRVAAADSAARAAIANERAIDAASLPARAVGVAPFAADPADTVATALAYGLADLLITDLSRSAALTVVDRLRADAVLRELRLAESGRVDSATAPRVGRLVGARRLVVGTVG